MTQQQSLTAEKITGTVDHIRYRGENGWCVVGMEDGTVCVGTMPGVRQGADVEIIGEWTEHPDHGRQLEVDTFSQHTPTDVDGLAAWLKRVDGVGSVYADHLAQAAGGDDVDPDDFFDADGVPEDVCEKAAEAWAQDSAKRDALIALQGMGLTSKQADRAWKRWGQGAPQRVESNPYCLTQLSQIGFERADGIARGAPHRIGFDDAKRLRAGCMYTLKEARQGSGHVGMPLEDLRAESADTLGVPAHKMKEPIKWMLDDGQLVRRHGLIYRATDDADEGKLADGLRVIDANALAIAPDADAPDTLTDEQAAAFRATLHDGGVVTLTGGPGTGKTYTLNAIVEAAQASMHKVRLAAPTGRAAKRMEEVTGQEAKTIHRLLGFSPDSQGFQCDPNEFQGLIIVDETSMLDTWLACQLIRCVNPSATLLFVGDPDQLPSVGPGYVLHDVIESDVGASVELTEIHRQAQGSGIVKCAYQVNAGDTPDLDRQYDDFNAMRVRGGAQAREAVSVCVDRLTDDEYGYSLTEDIQVLAPSYDGEAGVNALNEILQRKAHNGRPDGRELGGTIFAAGDRVMHLKNNYDLGVMNGDVGTVAEVAPQGEDLTPHGERETAIAVDYPAEGRVYYTAYVAASELTLAYACSIHKSQGSEYPVAITVLTFHYLLCERTLLYTAITRAADRGILIAEPKALHRAVENNSPVDRYRNLKTRLNKETT